MGVVIVLWKERLLGQLDVRKNPLRAGTFWIFLILILFYGFILLEVYHRQPAFFTSLTVDDLMLGLMLMTIIQSFLPSYQPLEEWIPRHSPYPRQLRLLVHLGLELMNSYYLILAALALLVLCYMGAAILPILSVLVLAIVVIHLLVRQIKMALEYRWESFPWTYILVFVAALVIDWLWSPSLNNGLAWCWRLIVLVLLTWWADRHLGTKRSFYQLFRRYDAFPPTILLVLRNGYIRVSFLVGLGFKVLILGLDTYRLQMDGVPLFATPALIWLWVSPAFVFTYVLNNLWGFLRGLSWLHSLALPGLGPWLRVQILTSIPLLVPDLCISVLYLSLTMESEPGWLWRYGLSMLMLWPLAMLASLLLPRRVDQSLSWRLNTHVWAAVISAIVVVGIYYLPLSPLVVAICGAGSAGMILWAHQLSIKIRHRLFHRLG